MASGRRVKHSQRSQLLDAVRDLPSSPGQRHGCVSSLLSQLQCQWLLHIPFSPQAPLWGLPPLFPKEEAAGAKAGAHFASRAYFLFITTIIQEDCLMKTKKPTRRHAHLPRTSLCGEQEEFYPGCKMPLPSGSSVTLWVLSLLESPNEERRGEKSEKQSWPCEGSSRCCHKYAAFLGTEQPIFSGG